MKRLNGFSLMEMMIVLTIVAIIAAASAPMVNRKMVRSATSNSSPWEWVNGVPGNSIFYNHEGNQNQSASIGRRITPNGVTNSTNASNARLYIDTQNNGIPHIAFGTNGNHVFKLIAGGAQNNLWLNDQNIGANTVNTIALGLGSTAAGSGSIAIGVRASANGVDDAIAIGSRTKAAQSGVAIGSSGPSNIETSAAGAAVAIGDAAVANDDYSIAIGYLTQARGDHSIAIGTSSNTTNANNSAIAIGHTTTAAANSAIALGEGARADNIKGIAIGNGATTTAVSFSGAETGGGSSPIAIGTQANAAYNSSIAFGNEAVSANFAAIAIGYGAKANASSSIAIGRDTFVKKGDPVGKSVPDGGCDSIALGNGARVEGLRSVAIGYNAKSDKNYEIVLGTGAYSDRPATTVYIPGNLVVGGSCYLGTESTNSRVTIATPTDGGSNRTYFGTLRVGSGDGNNKMISKSEIKKSDLSYLKWTPSTDYSDRRLKNVGKEFKAGLAELKKLEVFNYTFKDDKDKTPRVGVIAQDLQKIFPDAVFKGDDGFLRIRMEDMFYALLNAVKELDLRMNSQDKRIAELEKQNKELLKRIEQLEKKE